MRSNRPFLPLCYYSIVIFGLLPRTPSKLHTAHLGRCDSLCLPLTDKLAFRLGHIAEKLQNDIRYDLLRASGAVKRFHSVLQKISMTAIPGTVSVYSGENPKRPHRANARCGRFL